MKKIVLTSIFAFVFVLLGTETTHAVIDPNNITTVTCYNACSPNFTSYVGTVILDLQCDATSLGTYTGSLTVNGVSLSYSVDCAAVTLSADNTLFEQGGTTTLTWTTSNVTSCTASGGWSGSKDPLGNTEIQSPMSNTTYNIECWDAAANSTGVKTVDVEVYAPLTVSITGVPNPAEVGDTIRWTASVSDGYPPYTFGPNTWTGAVVGAGITATPSTNYIEKRLGVTGPATVYAEVTDSLGNTAQGTYTSTIQDTRKPQ
jgi:hypothetical protein